MNTFFFLQRIIRHHQGGAKFAVQLKHTIMSGIFWPILAKIWGAILWYYQILSYYFQIKMTGKSLKYGRVLILMHCTLVQNEFISVINIFKAYSNLIGFDLDLVD